VSALGDGVRVAVEGAPSFLRGRRRPVLAAWVGAALVVGAVGGAASASGLETSPAAAGTVLASLLAALVLRIVVAVWSRRDRRSVGEHWSVPPVSLAPHERRELEAARREGRHPDLDDDAVERARRVAVFDRRRLVPVLLAGPLVVVFLALAILLAVSVVLDGDVTGWTLLAPAYFAVTGAIGLVADTRRLGRTVALAGSGEPAYRVPEPSVTGAAADR